MVSLIGLEDLPEVRPGDDLAALLQSSLRQTGLPAAPGDAVIAICQKVVSKAEGQLAALARIRPAGAVRAWAEGHARDPREVQAVLAEARRVVRAERGVLITETHHGFVCANSGVDRSNAPPGRLCLLPRDPDASARRLAQALGEGSGENVGVIVTDTWGRPFRLGAVGVAIGVHGVPALLDLRGETDAAGRPLASTRIALADEIAAAADLVMGKLQRIPAVLVRGLPGFEASAGASGKDLLRDRGEDFFR